MHEPVTTAWTSSAADPSADAEELIVAHLYLVRPMVAEVAAGFPAHVDREELCNAGALGLVEAASRFEPAHGTPFARFAAARIKGAILDAARTSDWASRRTRRTARELDEAQERLQQRLGRTATDDEIAGELDMSSAEVHQLRAAVAIAQPLRLDQPTADSSDGEPWTLRELASELADERLPEPALLQRELLGTLRTAVAHLPDRLRELVERYYFAGHHLHDIAETMGVTSARLSQLRAEAITALRAYFAAHFPARELDVDDGAPGARQRADYLARLADHSWRDHLAAAG